MEPKTSITSKTPPIFSILHLHPNLFPSFGFPKFRQLQVVQSGLLDCPPILISLTHSGSTILSKKREICQCCGYPKFGGPDVTTYLYNRTEVLAGDWYCTALNCGAHNYASRSSCYRCGVLKSDFVSGACAVDSISGYCPDGNVLPPGWKTGDWICLRYGCGIHNYASRIECFKCKTPRGFGNGI